MYAQKIRKFIQGHPTEKKGDNSSASGSSRKHYGLSNPTMRDFVKQWAEQHPDLTYNAWQMTLSDLYHGDSIDEHCIAGFMLGHFKNFRAQLPLLVLDTWIGQLEGWREIDTTCQSNFTTKEVLANWDQWEPFLLDLAHRETIQHRRASLVLLVKPVRDSDDKRLIETGLINVNQLKHESDKLITKAVSWILREAIKCHRQRVSEYVSLNQETLSAIAIREFNKKLLTGRK